MTYGTVFLVGSIIVVLFLVVAFVFVLYANLTDADRRFIERRDEHLERFQQKQQRFEKERNRGR